MHVGAMSVDQPSASQHRERKDDEEPARSENRVWRDPLGTEIATQIKASLSRLDDCKCADDDECQREHRTNSPDAPMNARASGRDEPGLRQKQKEPRSRNDCVSRYERREWKWNVTL